MPGMVPEDVYELTGAGDPRLSPDGGTVAYAVWRIDKESNEYRGAIWTAPADGSSPPRQLTSGTKRDGSPRWSPDGTMLAFTSSRDGGATQVFVLPVGIGGEARKLTDLKEDVTRLEWSPDSTRLVFQGRVRDEAYEEVDDKKRAPRRLTTIQYKLDNEGWTVDRRNHLFVVPADGSSDPEQLTDGNFEDTSPAWSPDSSKIVFASARHDDWDITQYRDLYVIEADGSGEPKLLTATDGTCEAPSWSPDGSTIAFQTYEGQFDEPRHTQIGVLDVASGERTVLTKSLDRTCAPNFTGIRPPVWEDNRHVLFGVEDHGNIHLYRVAVDGSSEPELVVGGDLTVTGYDSVGGTLVHTAFTPTSLSEVFAGDRKLTDLGKAFADGRELAAPERFTAISPDGTEVDAWIMKPAGYEEGKTYPLLLNVHGGPFGQYGNRFFDEFQVYAGAGYAVVYSNPRGSSGYSEEFARAIRGTGDGDGWGSVDYDDCMAVVDEAIKRFDFVDADRLGVIGGSYGGFMASWMVGHTDRFQAAVSERSVNQWVSMWGSGDFGWDYKSYTGAFLFEDLDSWWKTSPSAYAKDITTPLLILHSENDLRCPIEQGEHLFVTLRLLKRPVEMVRFPAEGHELTRSGSPVHRVMRFDIVLEWLARHLQTA
jgi:dipeptidyl aminopeptidase/acylaminoacyl peptidase